MTDFDDQLRDELDRRVASVAIGRDWARHEILPGVLNGIETRPQRIATSRAPAFVGLAAAAAIILILVVAMPRLAIGPAATGSTEPSSTSPAATPAAVGVLAADEFARQLAAGELSGKTVVVEARIEHDEAGRPRFGATCLQSQERTADTGLAPNGTCLLGRLDGIEPAVWVQAPYVPTYDPELTGFPPITWKAPPPHVDGQLVLSVADDGLIRLVGRLRPSEPKPLMVSGAKLIDVENLELSDVVLVDAWLMGENIKECPATPDLGTVLPGRACDPSWLTDSQLGVRADSLLLQDAAYFQYAVDDDGQPVGSPVASGPQRGVFAISKRQEADGCPTEAPCWQWEIVGRVTPGYEPSGFSREISCAHPNASLPYGAPTITDEAGLVLSCSAGRPSSDPGGAVRVTNPNGDLRRLQLVWAGTPCDIASRFVLFPGPNGYVINGQRPEHACDASRVPHSMTLEINRDIDSSQVRASFNNSGPFPSPTPATREIPCSSEPITAVTITDETGLIALCEDAATPADGAAALFVENPDGEVYVLRITWTGVCTPSGRFALRPSGDHFELVVFVPPSNLICDGLPVNHDVLVYLDEPIPMASLQTTFVETPKETPPPVTTASWELAPSERPTASSDRINLFVQDPGCLQEPARPGRLLDPEITYDDSTVTITFLVDSGAGVPQCPPDDGYPWAVLLDEPLGDRHLVDGGAGVERVLSHDDGLMVAQPSDPLAWARARLNALLGDRACPTSTDQPPQVDEAALTVQAGGQLGAPEGIVGNRHAFWGSIDHAVTQLGGFELYQDLDRQRYMLALADGQAWLHEEVKPGDLVLADMSSISIAGGSSLIWVPGAHYQEFGSPDCDATRDVGGRLQASDSVPDFTISIRTDHVSNTAGVPLGGLDATLEYSGVESPLEILGSGTAFAWMTFSRIDGDFTPTWAMTADCHPYQLTNNETYHLEFLSSNFSGGPSTSLPSGIYRLDASAGFYVGGCPGPEVNLKASIFVRVR